MIMIFSHDFLYRKEFYSYNFIISMSVSRNRERDGEMADIRIADVLLEKCEMHSTRGNISRNASLPGADGCGREVSI